MDFLDASEKKGFSLIEKFLLITNSILFFSSMFGGEFVDILFDKSYYYPNETINIRILNMLEENKQIKVEITQGVQKVSEFAIDNYLDSKEINFSFKSPSTTGGYGLDLFIDNKLVLSRGFSVLSSWLDSPRYGFLTDFSKGRFDIEKNFDYLVQYHINSLQYYDWMYDYGDLVYEEGEEYKDAWNREKTISNVVLKELIEKGHEKNIFSMAYVSIYGVERNLGLQHPEWLLYQKKGVNYEPVDFYKKILITNTYNDSDWTKFLIQECKKTLEFGFDGIHLDQYGYPKDYTSLFLKNGEYKPYLTSKGFKEFINLLKKETQSPVFFNYVNNWPNEIQSHTNGDVIYIEPWESCNTYLDLYLMIKQAKKDSRKDVILAAYINENFEENVLLSDAVISASGGRRLELGEFRLLLAGPYFPGDAGVASQKLLDGLRNYYDYQIRYEQFLDLPEKELSLEGSNLSLIPKKNTIWYNIKGNSEYVFINFINFIGISTELWRTKTKKPEIVENLEIFLPIKNVQNVYFASPDTQIAFSKIDYEVEDEGIKIFVSKVEYWSSILIEL